MHYKNQPVYVKLVVCVVLLLVCLAGLTHLLPQQLYSLKNVELASFRRHDVESTFKLRTLTFVPAGSHLAMALHTRIQKVLPEGVQLQRFIIFFFAVLF